MSLKFDTKSSPWYIEQHPMNTFLTSAPDRKTETIVTYLAAVGFLALIAVGMWLAVYATRFVPTIVNSAGEAAVYIGSIFTPKSTELSVISSTTPTTIFFGDASSTQPASVTPTVFQPKPVESIAGTETSNTYQISGVTTSAPLSGLPDLVTNIIAIGYLTSQSTDSFVVSSTVPSGSRPAVRFVVKNVGTNVTGQWRFSASIPTPVNQIYQSPMQQSLNPGDYIEYILGFDQAISGNDKMISVSANFDRAFTELTTDNNSDSTKITILGN